MPINPNIAMSFQPPQFESPGTMMTRMAQMQALQDASEEKQYMIAQRAAAQQWRQGLNALVERSGGEMTPELLAHFVRAPDPAMQKYGLEGLQELKATNAYAQSMRPPEQPPLFEGRAPTQNFLGIKQGFDVPESQPLSMGNELAPSRAASALRPVSLDDRIARMEDMRDRMIAFSNMYPKSATGKNALEQAKLIDGQLNNIRTAGRPLTVQPGGALVSPQGQSLFVQPANLEARQPATDLSIVEGAPGTDKLAVQVRPGVAGGPPQVSATPILGTAKPTQAETLDVKDIAERNKKYVGAKTAVDAFETKAAEHIRNLKKLADHPGLNGITGVLYGRTPSVTGNARAAEVLFDKVTASDVLELIMDMKRQSPTGASPLGQFTDSDRETVKSTTGFSRILDAKDLRDELLNAAAKMEGVAKRARQAFSETYSYKQGTAAPATPDTTPATPDTTPAKDPYANLPRVTNDDDYRKLAPDTVFRGADNSIRRKPK
jgi:hypothetical protein